MAHRRNVNRWTIPDVVGYTENKTIQHNLFEMCSLPLQLLGF